MGPGYQVGAEPGWWWKVAQHLDNAQIALGNAAVHNLDDPRPVQALYERLREGQAILLEIFRAKGLLPAEPPAAAPPSVEASSVPTGPFGPPTPSTDDSAAVAGVPSDRGPDVEARGAADAVPVAPADGDSMDTAEPPALATTASAGEDPRTERADG